MLNDLNGRNQVKRLIAESQPNAIHAGECQVGFNMAIACTLDGLERNVNPYDALSPTASEVGCPLSYATPRIQDRLAKCVPGSKMELGQVLYEQVLQASVTGDQALPIIL